MKTSFIKSTALLLIVLSSATAMAQTSELLASTKTPETSGKTTHLSTELATTHATGLATVALTCLNPTENAVKIIIKNAEGRILFSERLGGLKSFRRNYDLSELGKGAYSFVVDNGHERSEKQIVF